MSIPFNQYTKSSGTFFSFQDPMTFVQSCEDPRILLLFARSAKSKANYIQSLRVTQEREFLANRLRFSADVAQEMAYIIHHCDQFLLQRDNHDNAT